MEISKTLLDELLKLNKKDWDKLKTNIDFLFSVELEKQKKEVFLSPITENTAKILPYPIHLLSE